MLKGPLLHWWIRRKGRRAEATFRRRLMQPPAPRPKTSPRMARGPIRSVLYIADITWEDRSLLPELEKICAVHTLNLRPALLSEPRRSGRARAVTSTIRTFAADRPDVAPDLIIFYARPQLLSEEVFDLLRRRWPCLLAGMNLDDKVEFLPQGLFSFSRNDDYGRWARKFDWNLTSSRAVADWYAEAGCPALYVAEGCHPADRPPEGPFRRPFSFLGSCRPEREAIVRRLRSWGLPLDTFGIGWPGSTAISNTAEIFRSTQINLGIGYIFPSDRMTNLKGRDFECPGAGGCYLTTWDWELGCHFDIGREILCYRSLEELVEIFSYYHRRPEECRQIGRAGHARCVRDHTWERRMRTAFAQMGFTV